jgi:hypothetical protein
VDQFAKLLQFSESTGNIVRLLRFFGAVRHHLHFLKCAQISEAASPDDLRQGHAALSIEEPITCCIADAAGQVRSISDFIGRGARESYETRRCTDRGLGRAHVRPSKLALHADNQVVGGLVVESCLHAAKEAARLESAAVDRRFITATREQKCGADDTVKSVSLPVSADTLTLQPMP